MTGAACLVYRGNGCTFNTKIANCLAAGATSVIIVNTAGQDLFIPSINPVGYPVFFVTFPVGEALRLALAAPAGGATTITSVQPTPNYPPLPAAVPIPVVQSSAPAGQTSTTQPLAGAPTGQPGVQPPSQSPGPGNAPLTQPPITAPNQLPGTPPPSGPSAACTVAVSFVSLLALVFLA